MNPPPARRCAACGTINPGGLAACLSCETLLPRAPATALPLAEVLGGVRAVDEAAAWRHVRGVAYLFLACLVVVALAFVAVRAGVAEVLVDSADTLLFALLVSICVVSARADLRPTLAVTGGARGLLAALVCLLALLAFGVAYFSAARWLGLPVARSTDAFVAAGWPRWSAYLLLSLAPAVYEELAFRGYVMTRLDRLFSPTETLVVQAALFAVLHLGVAIFPSHFVIGFALGLLRRRTGSLYPGMLVHAAWNALVVWTEFAGLAFP